MMSKLSQKEAVVNEVKSILGSNFNINLPAKDQLTTDQLTILRNNIVDGIINGNISYNKDVTDSEVIKKYVPGMISNHFRKSKDLNGGNAYTPQSTGRGSRDSQISELNKLLATMEKDTEEYSQVVEAIASRKDELLLAKTEHQKEKRKQREFASIDKEILPENLRTLADSLISNNV